MQNRFNPKALESLIEKSKVINSKKELSAFLGSDDNGKPLVKYDAVVSWFRSKNPSTPAEKVIIALCDKFGVDRSFFYGDNYLKEKSNVAVAEIDNTQSVAVLDMVAGFGTEGVLDPDFKVVYNIPMPREFIGKISPKYARVIRCLGDSMEPEFSDGDYLLIELLGDRHFIKRAGIYLVRVGEVVYIKRVEFLPNNDVRLISLNPAYGTIQPIKDYGAPYEVLGAVYGKISVKIGASFQFDTQGI